MRKVVRGGSYYSGSLSNDSRRLRTSNRVGPEPAFRGWSYGFRLVRTGRKQ